MKKIPATIASLHIDSATYSQSPVTIKPTFINIFFGNNGSGKSTIARTLENSKGITWLNTISPQDCKIYVYNTDYIKANFANYDNLPGVFMFNEKNIQIQNKINNLTRKKEELLDINNQLLSIENSDYRKLYYTYNYFEKACWSKTQKIRDCFKQAITDKLNKDLFANEVLNNYKPINHDLAQLKMLYDTSYSDNSTEFQKFTIVKDTTVLDNAENLDLIAKNIISSSDTSFANFVKTMNITAWVKQGMDHYYSLSSEKCPFCQQHLSETFDEDIKACFDEQFEKETQAIENLESTYKDLANRLLASISEIPKTDIDDSEIALYKNKLSAVKGIIASNLEIISKKQKDYATKYQLDLTKPLLDDISRMAIKFNMYIEEHNSIISTKSDKRKECRKQVWELISYILKDEIKLYKSDNAIIKRKLKLEKDKYVINISRINNLSGIIYFNARKTVSTRDSVEKINQLLKSSNFQGFYLREKTNAYNAYEVIRDDGTIATNLSEGERNFIAFLYFYHQIKENISLDQKNKNKIVVIDDPVSSMDSSALHIVSALIREMMCICENNVISKGTYINERYIKQLFILTHNSYFYKEITYDRAKDYQFVNFYLISKNDNKSSIRLCEKQNPEAPSEMMNYNPVQNSYAALWEEYKTLEAPIPLMNVIRRILEYYFLQLCGYDGTTLRDVILKQNKEKFICTDENGNNDYSAYQLASAMLSYIQTKSSLGITDGINYVDDCVDVSQTKETFKKIFTLMDQSQHYEMMMNKS